jgi:hypothetical protein
MPLRSLFSGPAASVSGVLHSMPVGDAVIVEVGGTSTNVSFIRGGRPRLAYVRVGNQATCLRSVDVWVAGVAGGSLARLKRNRVVAVGPRSAHIAGLRYASYAEAAVTAAGRPVLISPRAGDLADHLALDTESGRFALTTTCAANALARVAPDSYAAAHSDAARLAFEAAGRGLGVDGRRLAEQLLSTAAAELIGTIRTAASSAGLDLRRVPLIGVGGGAGALVPAVAAATGQRWEIAPHAEVLSSIGAAASLLQAVAERSAVAADPALLAEAVEEAERVAIAAGAAPASIETRTEYDRERRTLRAVATGSLPLQAGIGPAEADLADDDLRRRAAGYLGLGSEQIDVAASTAFYVAFAGPERRGSRPWALVDRHGALAHAGSAVRLLSGSAAAIRAELPPIVRRFEQHLGPASVAPPVLAVVGRRLIDTSALSSADAVIAAVMAALRDGSAGGPAPDAAADHAIVAVERERPH